jgi:hypothetical protein
MRALQNPEIVGCMTGSESGFQDSENGEWSPKNARKRFNAMPSLTTLAFCVVLRHCEIIRQIKCPHLSRPLTVRPLLVIQLLSDLPENSQDLIVTRRRARGKWKSILAAEGVQFPQIDSLMQISFVSDDVNWPIPISYTANLGNPRVNLILRVRITRVYDYYRRSSVPDEIRNKRSVFFLTSMVPKRSCD